jgi:hypothetical protein
MVSEDEIKFPISKEVGADPPHTLSIMLDYN